MTYITQDPRPLPAAGWYPDPQNPAASRYWDGRAWAASAPAPVPAPPVAPRPAPYAPYGPPPVRKKSKAPLVLAVIAVVALIVVIAAVASGGGTTSPSGQSGGSGGSAASPKAATVGTPVRDGQFEFTVSSVNCGATTVGRDFDTATAQGQFCVATMTVRNIGDESRMLDASSQYGYNAAGARYDASSIASLAANTGTQSFLNEINPGNQVTAKIVFDVPRGTKLAKLELHDSTLSGGATISVR